MSDQRKATPAETLERHITDPCIPKSEAEWWAHREIAKQREESEKLRAEIERLKEEPALLRAALIDLCNASRGALADAYGRARNSKLKGEEK